MVGAGLCCAALLAKYGTRVTVCESHYIAGGAAHGFDVKGYHFDAGPSFFAGLSGAASRNTYLLAVGHRLSYLVACSPS